LAITIVRDTVIPPSGISGGYGSISGGAHEPSTGVHGNTIFQTGNWYATASFDNGASFTPLDPFSIFGPGFCCDQVTLYQNVLDRQFWLLQYSDHLTLVSSAGSDLLNWCGYSFSPGFFGFPAGTNLDYNDVALSNNYIYFTTNVFEPAQMDSMIVRMSLAELIACGSAGATFLALPTGVGGFTWKPVQGATDTQFWGTNWGPGPLGTSFRVYSWPEVPGDQIFFNDATIDPYVHYVRNSGQNCASSDGIVNNWCEFSDSRVLGGYRANGVLGFSFNAKQDGAHPFPYTRRVYFNDPAMTYVRSDDLTANNAALLFLSLAPNGMGDVGGSFAWGGGTGTDHFYPGGAVMIEDPVTPTAPWDTNFFLPGAGNPCTSTGGLRRWGDYLTTRPNQPLGTQWAATNYAFQGGDCGLIGSFSEPHNVVFGR
jgi:hypothetical protein